MSKDHRIGSHTVSWLTAHIVWVTKYRYKVLEGDIQKGCRELVKQICDAEDVKILKGVVSKDHVHIHIEYRPSLNISDIVKRLKGRTSRKLQEEYPELSKRYWAGIFGPLAMEHGVLEILRMKWCKNTLNTIEIQVIWILTRLFWNMNFILFTTYRLPVDSGLVTYIPDHEPALGMNGMIKDS